MMMIAVLNSRCRSLSSSRIWACTVTSSAVVGSSAMSSDGSVEQRHRDHDALAHARRRAGAGSRRRGGPGSGCRRGRAWRSPACARPPSLTSWWTARPRRAACRSCRTGGGSTAGPGRSSPSSGRAACARSSSLMAMRSSPSRITWPEMLADLRLCRPMIACDVTLLPEPDSPTIATVWPRCDGERDAVDRADETVLGRELDLEVADVEVGAGRARWCSCSYQPHPRVDDGVQEVDDQVGHDDERRRHQGDADDDAAGRSRRRS